MPFSGGILFVSFLALAVNAQSDLLIIDGADRSATGEITRSVPPPRRNASNMWGETSALSRAVADSKSTSSGTAPTTLFVLTLATAIALLVLGGVALVLYLRARARRAATDVWEMAKRTEEGEAVHDGWESEEWEEEGRLGKYDRIPVFDAYSDTDARELSRDDTSVPLKPRAQQYGEQLVQFEGMDETSSSESDIGFGKEAMGRRQSFGLGRQLEPAKANIGTAVDLLDGDDPWALADLGSLSQSSPYSHSHLSPLSHPSQSPLISHSPEAPHAYSPAPLSSSPLVSPPSRHSSRSSSSSRRSLLLPDCPSPHARSSISPPGSIYSDDHPASPHLSILDDPAMSIFSGDRTPDHLADITLVDLPDLPPFSQHEDDLVSLAKDMNNEKHPDLHVFSPPMDDSSALPEAGVQDPFADALAPRVDMLMPVDAELIPTDHTPELLSEDLSRSEAAEEVAIPDVAEESPNITGAVLEEQPQDADVDHAHEHSGAEIVPGDIQDDVTAGNVDEVEDAPFSPTTPSTGSPDASPQSSPVVSHSDELEAPSSPQVLESLSSEKDSLPSSVADEVASVLSTHHESTPSSPKVSSFNDIYDLNENSRPSPKPDTDALIADQVETTQSEPTPILPSITIDAAPFPDPELLPLPFVSPVSTSPSPKSPSSALSPPSSTSSPSRRNASLSPRPAWSLRASESPVLSISPQAEVCELPGMPGRFPVPVTSPSPPAASSSSPATAPVRRRKAYRSPVPELDIALAMQLRPGLGNGADAAWMVRFLMAVFGWMSVLVGGKNQRLERGNRNLQTVQ